MGRLSRIVSTRKLRAMIFGKDIVAQFHTLYYESRVWHRTLWLGLPTLKCPLDLWIYQELIFELRPDVIVESGTAHGGSALYLANLCDLMAHGRVITIDIREREIWPTHDRIHYLIGSSTSTRVVDRVRDETSGSSTVLVILDSDHRKEHVLEELNLYTEFVTTGSYIVVEDTNVNGHPVKRDFGPGPMEAVHEFLKHNSNFVIDRNREKFQLTFNPKGFLKRLK